MAFHMLGMRGTHLKIARVVIGAVKVYVMHFFASAEGSPYRRLGHDNMLKHIALFIRARVVRDKKFFVAFLEDKGLLPVLCRAGHRAVFGALVSIEIRAAAMYASPGVNFWLWPRRVKRRDVMDAAEAPPKMLLLTSFGTAFPLRPALLPLLRKSSTALPLAVARHPAEMPLSLGVRLFDCRAAIETRHAIHKASVSNFADGNHFSIRHAGRA